MRRGSRYRVTIAKSTFLMGGFGKKCPYQGLEKPGGGSGGVGGRKKKTKIRTLETHEMYKDKKDLTVDGESQFGKPPRQGIMG